MNLLQISPETLSPNPWNTNSVSAENMEKLTASLERHGWVRPVIVRDDGIGGMQILGGQHRVEAAMHLGHETVPVVSLGEISDEKAKEIGLIDNARYGEDDALGLAALLKDIGGARQVAEFMPISDDEIASLSTEIDDTDIDDMLNDAESDDTPDEPSKKPTKTHEVMRFKVPIDDSDDVRDLIEKIMKEQGFTDSDSLTNAGDALVFLARNGDPAND